MVWKKIKRMARIIRGLRARKEIREAKLKEKMAERKRSMGWRNLYLERIKNQAKHKGAELTKKQQEFLEGTSSKSLETIYFEIARIKKPENFSRILNACIEYFSMIPKEERSKEALRGYIALATKEK